MKCKCITKDLVLFYSTCSFLSFFALTCWIKGFFKRKSQHQIECDGNVFCTSERVTSLHQKPFFCSLSLTLTLSHFSRFFNPRSLFIKQKTKKNISEILIASRLYSWIMCWCNMHALIWQPFYKIWNDFVFVSCSSRTRLSLSAFLTRCFSFRYSSLFFCGKWINANSINGIFRTPSVHARKHKIPFLCWRKFRLPFFGGKKWNLGSING